LSVPTDYDPNAQSLYWSGLLLDDEAQPHYILAVQVRLGSGSVPAVLMADIRLDQALSWWGAFDRDDGMRHYFVTRYQDGWEIVAPGTLSGTPEPGVVAVLDQGGDTGGDSYRNDRRDEVFVAYRWIDNLDVALIAETEGTAAMARPVKRMALALLGIGIVVSAALTAIVHRASKPVTDSLDTLKGRLRGGSEGRLVTVDELSPSLNRLGLTAAYNTMVSGLEVRWDELTAQVEAKTQALMRRSLQMQAAAQVSSAVSDIRDLSSLLDTTVRLIPDYFGHDHAGIFIIDDRREYAVLQAASSEGGARMLARRHKLRLGQGIVGSVALSGQPRVALDVGEDPVFFDNPDLPATRSEMALPLAFQGRVIGVLDVQSNHSGAFTDDDVAVLQSIADQVAVAIDSANRIEENERVLRELRDRYAVELENGWRRRFVRGRRPDLGFRYDGISVLPIDEDNAPLCDLSEAPIPRATLLDAPNGSRRLIAPIVVRDVLLGHLVYDQDATDEPWTAEDLELVDAISTQIAEALEDARLLRESQLSAARERATREITDRLRGTLDWDELMRTAVQEIGQAVGATDVYVQWLSPEATASGSGLRDGPGEDGPQDPRGEEDVA
jgi:GAF domain-containing protein